MAPRPRKAGNQDLPPFVSVNKKDNGTTYFRYLMPDGTRVSLGTDKSEAVLTALTLNAELARNPALLSRILNKRDKKEQENNPIPFFEWARKEFAKRLLTMKYADSVRNNQRQMLNRYGKLWDEKRINDITHLDVTAFMNTLPPHAYVKHKAFMEDLWQFFLHQGWTKENHPANTMEAIIPEKDRLPISHDQLMAIRAISPDYLVRAIDVALHSLQRRGDIVKLHRTMINILNNTLTVYQGKSQNYAKPIWIEIDMHPELRDAVIACLTDPLAFRCPYLMHYQPKLINKQVQSKVHFMAMTPNWLSNEFAEYRDKSGLFDHLEAKQKPTFHEIRALGEFMVKEKYGKEYAKALAGHETDEMYDHYVGRHEEVKPERISYR